MATRRDVIGAAAGAMTLGAPLLGRAAPARLSAKVELFGHRGAPALRPEHTLASYARAIADGADYIEPDLVITRDGVLVIRHENNMVETTDVKTRPEFAHPKTTKTIDGEKQTGWFTEDFTLAELKTLRAVERLPAIRKANTAYDGEFQILTFEEMIDFAAAMAATRGRDIGLVPEIKHSTYFASIGQPMEDRFLNVLASHKYMNRAPVEIQSFEVNNLKYLRTRLGRPKNVRLMQLVGEGKQSPVDIPGRTFGDLTSADGMKEIGKYADVVAPPTRSVIPLGKDGKLLAPTAFVADAHAAGLLVHIWTFRPENLFLAADFRSGAPTERNTAGSVAEMRRYIAAGIDGFFSDDPGLGRLAIDGAA